MVKIKTVIIILKILANFIVHQNFDNEISSINFIDTYYEKGYSSNRQRMKNGYSFQQVLWQNWSWF